MPKIDSRSYMLNDPDLRPQVFQSLFKASSYDFTPNSYSSRFQKDMDDGYQALISAYASRQGEHGVDIDTRFAMDTAMAAVTGKPIDEVNRNHNAYVKMIMGRDMEDKDGLKAFSDSWRIQDHQAQLAELMNRFDDSDDEDEKAQLMDDIRRQEEQMVLLGDYDSRGGVASLLIDSAPVLNQLTRTAMYGTVGALALSALVLGTGGLGGVGLAGGLLSLGGAATAGAAAGAGIDAVVNVYGQERGMLSYELYNMVDDQGRRMDDDTRKRFATIGGMLIAAAEFISLGPLTPRLFGKSSIQGLVRNGFVKYIKEAGTRTVSESTEEFVQGAIGSIATDIAKNVSDSTGKTSFGGVSVEEMAMNAMNEAVSSFQEALGPSFVASLLGTGADMAINSDVAYRNLAKKTGISASITAEEAKSATSKQMMGEDSGIARARDMDFKRGRPSSTVEPSNTEGKYSPINVRVNEQTGRLEGVTQRDQDLAKQLYDQGQRSFVVNIHRQAETAFSESTLRGDLANYNAVLDIGETTSEEHGVTTSFEHIIFATEQDKDRWLVDRSADVDFSSGDFRTSTEAVTEVTYLDEEGNRHTATIQVDPTIVEEVLGTSGSTQTQTEAQVQTEVQTGTGESMQTSESTQMTDEQIVENEDKAFVEVVEGVIDDAVADAKFKKMGSSRTNMAKATAAMLNVIERATGISRVDMLSDRLKFVVDTDENASSGYLETEDGEAGTVYRIALNRKSTTKTVVHELSHVLRLTMGEEDLARFNRAYFGSEDTGGWMEDIADNGDGTFSLGKKTFKTLTAAQNAARRNEERFVDDFMNYLRTHEAPNAEVRSVFDTLREVAARVVNSFRNVLSPEVVSAFDQIMSRQPVQGTYMDRRLGGDVRLYESNPEIERIRRQYQDFNTIELRTGEDFLSAHRNGYIIPSSNVMERAQNGNAEERAAAQHEAAIRSMMKAIPESDVGILARTQDWNRVVERIPALGEMGNGMTQAYFRLHGYLWAPVLQRQIEAFKAKYGSYSGLMRLREDLKFDQSFHTVNHAAEFTRRSAPYRSRLYQRLDALAQVDERQKYLLTDDIVKSFDMFAQEWLRLYYDAGNGPLPGYEGHTVEEMRYYVGLGTETEYNPVARRNRQVRPEALRQAENITMAELDEMKAEFDRLDAKERKTRIDEFENTLSIDGGRLELERKWQEANYRRLVRRVEQYRRAYERNNSMLRERLEDVKDADREKAKRLNEEIAELKSMNYRLGNSVRRWSSLAEKTKRRLDSTNEKLYAVKARYAKDLATRGIRRTLRFSSARHDASYVTSVRWMDAYIHGGNRFFGQYRTYTDVEFEMKRRLQGAADMGGDGSDVTIEVDLDALDPGMLGGDEAPNWVIDAIGMYRYDQKAMPSEIADRLSPDTRNAIIEGGVAYEDLTASQAMELRRVMEAARHEAIEMKSRRDQARNQRNNSRALDMAASIDGRYDVITDELRRQAVASHLNPTSEQYNSEAWWAEHIDDLTDDEVRLYMRNHPSEVTGSQRADETGIRALGRDYWLMFSKMNNIARFLDGSKEGMFYETLLRQTLEHEQEYIRNKHRRQTEFYEGLESVVGRLYGQDGFLNSMKQDVEISVGRNGTERKTISRWELLGAYIYSMNMNTFRKLVNGNGNGISLRQMADISPEYTRSMIEADLWQRDRQSEAMTQSDRDAFPRPPLFPYTREEVQKVLVYIDTEHPQGMLTDTERKVADLMISLLAKEQQRYAQAAYDNANVVISIQDNYFPSKSVGSLSTGDLMKEIRKMKTVKDGAKNDRNPYAMYELDLNVLATFLSAIDEQERYINMAGHVNDLNHIFTGRNTGNNILGLVEKRYGKQYAKYIEEYVGAIANRHESLSAAERFLNQLLGNVARAKLAANLMTSVKQLVSIIPAVTDGLISPADWGRTALMMADRHKRAMIVDTVKELAPEVYNSSAQIELQMLREMVGDSRMKNVVDRISDKMMKPISATDSFVKYTVWYAAFSRQIERKTDVRTAALRASELVGRTQSVASPEFLAPAQRQRNPMWRSIILFTNDLFQQWNILFGGARMDLKDGDMLGAVSKIFGSVLNAGVLALLAGHFLPDDDDENDGFGEFLRDMGLEIVDLAIPVAGPWLSDIFSGFTESMWQQLIGRSIVDPATMIWRSATDEKEYTADEWIENLLEAIATGAEPFVSFPTVAVKRMRDMLFDDDYRFSFNPGYLLGNTWGDGLANLFE